MASASYTPWLILLATACAQPPAATDSDPKPDTVVVDSPTHDTDPPATDSAVDTDEEEPVEDPPPADPFADRVVSFTPGEAAGFGADGMPGVVLGHPMGSGPSAGSLDVVSLGRGGEIVLAFDDLQLVDGPGPDLLVFENPFSGFYEPGEVSVSLDGDTWHTWPCAAEDVDNDFPGCAGVRPVSAHELNQPYDIAAAQDAGGDAFDLADLGLTHARYVRVRDAEAPTTWYQGTSGGFDLDGIAVVNGEAVSD